MKAQKIKKRLLVESAVIIAAVMVLGGLLFYLSLLNDDYITATQVQEGQLQSTSNELNTLRDKYTKMKSNNALYQEALQKNTNNQLSLRRQSISDLFNQFRDRYYLGGVHFAVAPTQDMQGVKYIRKTNVMISSEVSVSFDACTDELIYAMLAAMKNELPGSAKIVKLNISRPVPLSESMLSAMSQGGSCPLIKSEMKFLWFGLKPVESNAANGNVSK